MRARRLRPALFVAVLALAPAVRSRGATPSIVASEVAEHIEASIVGLDFDEAHRELRVARAVMDDPRIALERARLALYELDCDGAAAILARPEVQHLQDGEALADTAHGCRRVIASLAESKDETRGIEILWQDENDAPLGPLLFDTVARARESLSRDLGVDWPLPTRIVVVRDLLSLSAMTGLPYESAKTTGTVAVAKWGRVTLLSPRASRHGFAWLDTVAHELTHLAVTRATDDRAPLWLQEGIAKREETLWRTPGPFDGRPSADAIAQHGFERGMAVPLDKLGPSIAMLPTADAARVAFAEVTSFVGFYLREQGTGALTTLFRQLKNGRDPGSAIEAASGSNFQTWDSRWRTFLASSPREALPALLTVDEESPKGRRANVIFLRQLRDRTRLAELLLGRGHPAEALDELARLESRSGLGAPGPAGPPAAADASVEWLHGRALEMLGRSSELAPLVSDPGRVVSSYGPWWALRGRWARSLGDKNMANDSFFEALAVDPLDPEVACGALDAAVPLPAAIGRSLCDAAKARDELPFGGD